MAVSLPGSFAVPRQRSPQGSAGSLLSCPSSKRTPHSLIPGTPATSTGSRAGNRHRRALRSGRRTSYAQGSRAPRTATHWSRFPRNREARGCFTRLYQPGQVLPIKLVTAFPEAIMECCIASQGEEIKESAQGCGGWKRIYLPLSTCALGEGESPAEEAGARGKEAGGPTGSGWELGLCSPVLPVSSLVCTSREKQFVRI